MDIFFFCVLFRLLCQEVFGMNTSLSERVVQNTKKWFLENGRDTAVIGISGGKDSAVAAAICVKALGKEHVIGVLLPDGEQSDLSDAKQVVAELDIPHIIVNIGEITKSHRNALASGENHGVISEHSQQADFNLPPRVRMAVLYEIAQSQRKHAAVVGTGNAAEIYVGYTTKWGDSASDFNPLKNLWVHEVVQIGLELGFFPNIVQKAPADGLTGRTDEQQLGFSYNDVYRYAIGENIDPVVADKIKRRHKESAHKRSEIPTI